MPLLVCNIHIIHNGFKKGIDAYGQLCEQLCFDLRAWFKQSPCKEEDYRALSDDICIEDSSLFLHDVNTRWLTLLPALVRVSERWEDTKKYFITFLPFKKENKRHLPKNQSYQRIQTALKNENETKMQIAFLKNIAPLFQKYLTMFHLIHHKLKSLVRGTMERFVKKEAIIGASDKFSTKSLINVDLTKQKNLLMLDKMDVGDGVRDILKKCKPSCRNENLKNMQAAFTAMASYFIENLSLSSQLLNDVMSEPITLKEITTCTHMQNCQTYPSCDK